MNGRMDKELRATPHDKIKWCANEQAYYLLVGEDMLRFTGTCYHTLKKIADKLECPCPTEQVSVSKERP